MSLIPTRAVGMALVSLAGLLVASGVARGHVRYVTDAEEVGDSLAFLAGALSDPLNVAVLGGGGVAVVVAAAVYLREQPCQRDIEVFRETMRGYSDLLPWLLRLGFGLPLVGAGFAGYFFNPLVDPMIGGGVDRLLSIGLGFALLFGLATRAAALVGLVVYLLALPFELLLFFSLEWIPGLIAIAFVGSGRPSADHTLQQIATAEGTVYGRIDPIHRPVERLNSLIEPYKLCVPIVIRVGMGVAFVLLGLFEKLFAPQMATAVVAQYDLTAIVPVSPEVWVIGAGLAEIGLGIAIILGLFTRISAISALFVFTLTLFGLPDDPVLAHIGMFSLASALLITGAGPYALDNRIGALKPRLREEDTKTPPEATASAED